MNLEVLSEIAEIHSGAGFPKKYQGETQGDLPFAKVGDISNAKREEGKTISRAENYVTKQIAQQLRAKVFPKNSIVFAKIGEAIRKNNRAITSLPMTFDNNVMGIIPNAEKVSPQYLYHFLETVDFYTLANSTTVPSIRKTDMEKLEIPLPPLEEQKRIAAILDQADALRRLRQRAIDRLNELGQAIFYEMFGDPATNPMGWPTEKCGTLCERITVGIVVRPASYYQPSGVPAIRGTNIKPSGIDLSDVVYFSESDNETRLSKTRVWEGDLVIVRSGRPGLAAVVSKGLSGVNSIDVLIATPSKHKVKSYFLRDLINSKGGKAIVLSESKGQVQQHFNVGSLSDADLILPPMRLQTEYELMVSDIERQMTQLRKGVDRTSDLFGTLQHRAFRGEL
ncbi:restriction endonuclease subunit S [Candidatus Nitrospira allomarina]|uniref:Restriction endonuclease subunit S n=1 Tax=Candidatus Nitrospira allomarina TaxID=3020900 RepID=A0AA96G700_9BACT|nr:restriction endonuclease subunit S [Candidatus Nitrospira allomarina]WNM56514.1 restriction endonuclease subunit S [Candidatus Nitrospira allomarina]